jgi:hypothetical protein
MTNEENPETPISPVEMRYRGPEGPRGEQGETGRTGPVLPSVFAWFLLALVLIMGGANLAATYFDVQDSQATQKQQVCEVLKKLASLKPPPGSNDAQKYPGRAFEQELHTSLAQLTPTLGCTGSG